MFFFPKILKYIFSFVHSKRSHFGSAYDAQVSSTSERIDLEKLKAREQIMFFEDVLLFEDELHDHGVSMISVKIVSETHYYYYYCNILLIYKCLDLEES